MRLLRTTRNINSIFVYSLPTLFASAIWEKWEKIFPGFQSK
jgi:hypothetical protein